MISEGRPAKKEESQAPEQVVDTASTILNRLIELSNVSVDATTPVFAVLPVRPFKSSFGFDVRALTALTDQTGVMSLLDVEGHVIADTTLNATLVKSSNSTMPTYSPEYIVRPSHLSDQMFGVVSLGRFDAFRFKVDEGETARKNVTLTHVWTHNLED
jgi:hypothetical protein